MSMFYKGPHISIAPNPLVERILGLSEEEFKTWPEHVREVALALTAELFLIRYNPFIDPQLVWKNVQNSFAKTKLAMSEEYSSAIITGMFRYWNRFREDQKFTEELLKELSRILPSECIRNHPSSRVECSTDATDLRLDLPLLVLSPTTTEQICHIVRLAEKMGFSLVARGGGSGLTGGSIPGHRRTVVLSVASLNSILHVDIKEYTMSVQAGVVTMRACEAAANHNLLFTVDPASKTASTIGGNISENSGGPFAFEYGCTIDNIVSFKMVVAKGKVLFIQRKNHPCHKILPHETAVFEIMDEKGILIDTIELAGTQLRAKGLGKDVTDKYLQGLPGVQKEGVDGIITEATFVLHPAQAHSRVLCMEFFGRSMRTAMQVIKDIVALRDKIREEGDFIKISALEEFGVKYVQAIEYQKKSTTYEGDPISVLLVQLDSNDEEHLDNAVMALQTIAFGYDDVDIFVAKNKKEAEFFWEDRHKFSAIARRTSGFKINEDVVIPLEVIPQFAEFLEELNLYYLALGYRQALQTVGRLPDFGVQDKYINMEFSYASRIIDKEVDTKSVSEQELEVQVYYFFRHLKNTYPGLKEELDRIYEEMQATRIVIANHMHAGDGNNHVNLPVNSNDPNMMALADEAAHKVAVKVAELGGAVSGEHGIGITKIGFLPEEKIKALATYKKQVDPQDIFNPGKLTARNIPGVPFTFSFNKLIQDLARTGLADRRRLMSLLSNVQICTRCGKCKYVCPMFDPGKALTFHPRNRNISLGAMVEALYYTLVTTGETDSRLMQGIQNLMEHCTACGKCMSVCPVKINTPEVTVHMRTFLEDKGVGGHPLKSAVLHHLAKNPQKRIPRTARMAAFGQIVVNRTISIVPKSLRKRFYNPLLRDKGPLMSMKNLSKVLYLEKGTFFVADEKKEKTVLYFPGCGAGIFNTKIGLAGLFLLLRAGVNVILPEKHLCCGYPLLAAGCEEAFMNNRSRNMENFTELMTKAHEYGLIPDTVLTSCGTCREGLKEYHLETLTFPVKHKDLAQYLFEEIKSLPQEKQQNGPVLFHAACHAEWSGVKADKAGEKYRTAIARFTGHDTRLSPGCCGEAGFGAVSSPKVYNKLRAKKQKNLACELEDYPKDMPVLVGCPSCFMGINRSLITMQDSHKALHVIHYLAQLTAGKKWKKMLLEALEDAPESPVRRVSMDKLFKETEGIKKK